MIERMLGLPSGFERCCHSCIPTHLINALPGTSEYYALTFQLISILLKATHSVKACDIVEDVLFGRLRDPFNYSI